MPPYYDPYAEDDSESGGSFEIGQDFSQPEVPVFKPIGGPRPEYKRALMWPSIKAGVASTLHTIGSVASAPFRGVGTAIGVGVGALQGDPLKYSRLPYAEQQKGIGADIAGAFGLGTLGGTNLETTTPFEIGRQGIEAAATEIGGGVAPDAEQKRAFARANPWTAGIEAGAEVAGELGSQVVLDPLIGAFGHLAKGAARGAGAEAALASRVAPEALGALSPEAVAAAGRIAESGRRYGTAGRALGAAFIPGMAMGAAESIPATEQAIEEFGAWSPEAIKAAGHGLGSAAFAALGLKHAIGGAPTGRPEIGDLVESAATRARRLEAVQPRRAAREGFTPEELAFAGEEPFVAPPDWVSPEVERRAAAREIIPEEAGIVVPEGGFAETFPEIGVGRREPLPERGAVSQDAPFYDPLDDILSTDMTPRLRGTPRSAEIPADLATLSPRAREAAAEQGAIGEAPPSNVLDFEIGRQKRGAEMTPQERDVAWPAFWRRESDPVKAAELLGDYIKRLRTEGNFSEGQVLNILTEQELPPKDARAAVKMVSETYGIETTKERLAKRDINVAIMRRQAENARRTAEETAMAERLAGPEQQPLELPAEQRGMDRRQAEVPVEQDRRAGDRRRVAAEVQLPEDHPAVERLVAAEEGRAQAEQVADTDAGTGLPGKRGWERILETVTPEDHVVAIDLSGFKPINDKIGHKAGDEVLNTVARVARKHFGDTAARYGGDEFGGLVRGGTREEALAKGEAFRAELAETRSQWKNEDTGEVVDIQPVDAHIGVGATQAEADAAANAVAAPKREARRLAAEQIEREQLRRDQARTEPGDSELDRQGIPPREPEPGSAAPATAAVEDRGADVPRPAGAARPAPAEVRAEQPAELAPPDLSSTAEYLRGLLPELEKPGYLMAPGVTRRSMLEESNLTFGNTEKTRWGGVSRKEGLIGLEDEGASPIELAKLIRRGDRKPDDPAYRGLLERVFRNLEAHAEEIAVERRRQNYGAEFTPEAMDAIEPLSPEEQALSDAEADKFAVRREPRQEENFRRWFGESKIVDEAGEPRQVFHGSAYSPEKFAKRYAEDGSFGKGFYFTPDSAEAARYGDKITPVYLSIKNPASMADGLAVQFDTAKLKRRGFDGIVIKAKGSGKETIVAFEPEQIKSATANRGTFDAENPDIRFAVRRPRPGQKGLPGIADDVEAAQAKEKAPEQRSMFGGQMMQGVEKKVPEGREASGPLFQQEQARAAKEEAGRQTSLTSEPESIAQSLREAARSTDAMQKRYGAQVSALPDGTSLGKGWEKRSIDGDHFVVKGNRWVPSNQAITEIGTPLQDFFERRAKEEAGRQTSLVGGDVADQQRTRITQVRGLVERAGTMTAEQRERAGTAEKIRTLVDEIESGWNGVAPEMRERLEGLLPSKRVLDQETGEAKFAVRKKDEREPAIKLKPYERDEEGSVLGGAMKAREDAAALVRSVDPQRPTTPEFKAFFGASKVVDQAGEPLPVYRGDNRSDLVGTKFKKGKATSGRFYFTEDPAVASGYALTKSDPHASEALASTENWFQFKPDRGARTPNNLRTQWYRLSPEEQARVKDVMLKAGEKEEGGFDFTGDNSLTSPSHWDDIVKREARGNWLKAADEIWLQSGALFGREKEFGAILKEAGLGDFKFDSPSTEHPGVFPVYLSVKRPLDTSAIPTEVVDALGRVAKSDRTRAKQYGADSWDKTTITTRDWYQRFLEDQKNGTTHAWTQIPEKVTDALQALGYDGIKDSGGKNGGQQHAVWIAFEPEQIKSAIANRGTYDPSNADIRFATAEKAPTFYSQLERVASKIPQAMSGSDMMRYLSDPKRYKEAGAIKEELKWSGLDDYLRERAGKKVTPAEVKDFLAQNRVEVKEVTLGEKAGAVKQADIDAAKDAIRQAMREDGFDASHEDVREWMDTVDSAARGEQDAVDTLAEFHPSLPQSILSPFHAGEAGRTKFGQYQLPGGSAYKELLLTLPEKAPTELPEGFRLEDHAGSIVSRWEVHGPGKGRYSSGGTKQEAIARFYQLHGESVGEKKAFKSGHFDAPNILAHVRFNERTDAQGKRVLFLEELQSDFGQKFRREQGKIKQAVADNWTSIVKKMQDDGVLKVECD